MFLFVYLFFPTILDLFSSPYPPRDARSKSTLLFLYRKSISYYLSPECLLLLLALFSVFDIMFKLLLWTVPLLEVTCELNAPANDVLLSTLLLLLS